MKSVRIFVAIIALLAVVVIFITVNIQLLIDPNRLKPIIVSEFKNSTGFDLKIEGDLHWSFYPLFSISVPKITISEPNQTPFLELENINVGTPLGKILFKSENLSGFLDVENVTFMGVHANTTSLRFILSEHSLNISPLYTNFYGGTLHATLFAHDFHTQPKWDGNIEASNVQIQPLLIDLHAIEKLNLLGNAKISITANSEGKTTPELLQHLNGAITFNISEGLLMGVDLDYLLESAKAMIKREEPPKPPAEPSTAFDVFKGGATVELGVANLEDALLNTSTYRAISNGTIDLVKQNFDLKLQISPLNTSDFPWVVPVLIQGGFQNPKVGLDMEEINKMVIKAGIEKITERVQGELDELPPAAQAWIQKLMHSALTSRPS